MSNSIFPILVFDILSINPIDIGTGFFINKEGYFISAGHVFKNKDLKYRAKVDDIEYEVEKILYEYIEDSPKKPSIYKDLFIGKVKLYNNVQNPLILSKKLIENKTYTTCGYSRLISQEVTESHKTLDELNDTEYEIEIFNKIEYHAISYKLLNNNLVIEEPEKEVYTNGFTLDMLKDTPGLSGGPVISDKLVKGMLIRTSYCISAKYIIEKLKENKISYQE